MNWECYKGESMKVQILAAVGLLAVSSICLIRVARSAAPPGFLYETGEFGVNGGEFAAGIVFNSDVVSHNYRVIIYRLNGSDIVSVADTGVQSLAARTFCGTTSPVEPGALDGYTVEITTDSDRIVPSIFA